MVIVLEKYSPKLSKLADVLAATVSCVQLLSGICIWWDSPVGVAAPQQCGSPAVTSQVTLGCLSAVRSEGMVLALGEAVQLRVGSSADPHRPSGHSPEYLLPAGVGRLD